MRRTCLFCRGFGGSRLVARTDCQAENKVSEQVAALWLEAAVVRCGICGATVPLHLCGKHVQGLPVG